MARYKIDCCHHCEDREVGCHGWCETYKNQREELDQTKAVLLQNHAVKSGLQRQLFDSYERNQKRLNYRSKNRRGY